MEYDARWHEEIKRTNHARNFIKSGKKTTSKPKLETFYRRLRYRNRADVSLDTLIKINVAGKKGPLSVAGTKGFDKKKPDHKE